MGLKYTITYYLWASYFKGSVSLFLFKTATPLSMIKCDYPQVFCIGILAPLTLLDLLLWYISPKHSCSLLFFLATSCDVLTRSTQKLWGTIIGISFMKRLSLSCRANVEKRIFDPKVRMIFWKCLSNFYDAFFGARIELGRNVRKIRLAISFQGNNDQFLLLL